MDKRKGGLIDCPFAIGEKVKSLELVNVTKKYGKTAALDDFSYSFENRIYAILGPNGSY